MRISLAQVYSTVCSIAPWIHVRSSLQLLLQLLLQSLHWPVVAAVASCIHRRHLFVYYKITIETTALNCLVFEKVAFLQFGDRQTDRQTNEQTNKQTDRHIAWIRDYSHTSIHSWVGSWHSRGVGCGVVGGVIEISAVSWLVVELANASSLGRLWACGKLKCCYHPLKLKQVYRRRYERRRSSKSKLH